MKNIQPLGRLAESNFRLVQNRTSIQEALALARENHLVILQGERPVGTLTMEEARQLPPAGVRLNEIAWAPPLMAGSETDTLAFCREHAQDLRSVVVLDDSGRVTGLVTLTKLLNVLLEAWEVWNAFFNTLLDTVNEAITVVTENGTVSHWNLAAQEMYNISGQAIIGKPIAGFFEREALATLKMLDEGRPIRQSYHRPRSGTHVLINASPVLSQGKIVGAISSEQDITQVVRLNEELSHASSQLRDLKQKIGPSDDPFNRIIGRGSTIHRTMALARKVAASEATVLITGESGVGKELFAHAIHASGQRADKPFIAINCGAIPNALFESELFGYQGGAFTGAERRGKPGKLELAHGGTIFLDEVGELPVELQVKLLRVLQDKRFYRVGGTEPVTVNTRIIAATNRDLDKMIRSGEFREDLYYRLNVIALEVPPLRERTEDIPELMQMFLQEFALKYNKPIPALDPELVVTLLGYPWPGNVRELRNVAERLAILAEEAPLDTQFLPPTLQRPKPPAPVPAPMSQASVPASHQDLSAEARRILQMLEQTKGNKAAAAKLLGLSRGTLYYKLKGYGLI